MKKKLFFLTPLILFAVSAFGQQKYVDSDARDVVSGVPVIFSNAYGATVGGFGYQLTGNPTSVSIRLQGCFADGNGNELSPPLCDTIETFTGMYVHLCISIQP